jgi:predicted dehydrogenase
MKRIEAALIGCGRIGFLLEGDPLRYKPCTHFGGAIAAGIKIKYAVDANPQRLSAFIESAGISAEKAFPDHRKLFALHTPDLVIIATWTDSHHRIAMDAARSGVRCIVLEKPVSSSLKQTRELLDLCEKNNVFLIVNHERRFDGRYRKVREMIQGGRIGAVRSVHASILTGRYRGKSDPSEGGGPLLHDGTHIVDMLRFLLGDITTVRGEFRRFGRDSGFEDSAAAWLRTSGGIDIFLEAGGGRNYFVFELAISGESGKIIIGNGYEKLFLSRKSRYYTGFRDLAEAPFPAYRKDNCFVNLYREAADLLKGKKNIIQSSGTDGYRALEVIHAIYLSAARGSRTLALPIDPGSVNLKKIFGIR